MPVTLWCNAIISKNLIHSRCQKEEEETGPLLMDKVLLSDFQNPQAS